MAERLYWRDIRARIGIWLKVRGCLLIHGMDPATGEPAHPWGSWRMWPGGTDRVRACTSCGVYDHEQPERGRVQ
jgi:hypothetical protein